VVLLQIMSLILACLIILILVVERAKKKFFQLLDALKFLKERNRKLRRDVEDIFGIYEGIKNVATTLKFDEILQIMSQLVHKYFEFSFATLYLFSEEDAKTFITLRYDFVTNLLSREKTEIVDSNIKDVIAHRREIISPEEKEIHDYFEEGVEKPPIFMIVPLIVEGKVIGVIEMRREGEPFLPFSADDLHKLSNLCAQTSVFLRRTRLYAEVERLAIVDGLTGLYVHRYFQEKLTQEMKRAKVYDEKFSLLMADIDYFKRYNDQFGHLAGDELLRRVSMALKEGVRETDIVSRYGGEEFAIILLHREKEEAEEIAEGLRKRVESMRLEVEGGNTGVTISMGLATFPEDGLSESELIKHADEALYRAKEGGRNRVVVYRR